MDGVSQESLSAIFILKVVAGILYGIIHDIHRWGGDTFVYFYNADLIFRTFLDHPQYYLCSAIGIETPFPGGEMFRYPPPDYYFKHFGVYAILQVHAIIRIFSFGFYNIHVVFMAFFSLTAGVMFYRMLHRAGGILDKNLAVGVFFVPSVLFWTSGIHKDCFVYLGLALLMYGISKYFWRENQPRAVLYVFLGLLTIVIFRGYLLALILPAGLAYALALRRPERGKYYFAVIYAACAAFVFFSHLFNAPWDPLRILSTEHAKFALEKGTSDFGVPRLEPSFMSYLAYIPIATLNTLFRPFITECHYFLQYLASFEMWLFVFGALVALFFLKKKPLPPIYHFLSYYAISNLMLIGFLLSNSGTLARYRAIALGFLVLWFMANTDYGKLRAFIRRAANAAVGRKPINP